MTIQNKLTEFISAHPSLFPKRGSVLIACSGGPDSVALAWAVKQWASRAALDVHIGHVDHGLRGNQSRHDAEFVRRLGQRLRWPVHVEKRRISKGEAGNLEEKARVERYDALFHMARRFRCGVLFTAHTLDDQVESILMNVGRGAGLVGLGGMSPLRRVGPGLFLARPFLDVEKTHLLDFVNEHNLPFRFDQSNSDTGFLRNWVRLRLLPMWEGRVPGIKKRIATLSRIAREEQDYWVDVEKEAFDRLFSRRKGSVMVDFRRLRKEPVPLQRRLIRRAAGLDLLTFEAVERLRTWMTASPSNKRFFELKQGWRVERLPKAKGHSSAQTFRFYQSGKVQPPAHRKKLRFASTSQ